MEATEKPGSPASITHAPSVQRSLVRKLAAIMGEVERIPKSGYNEFHKYNYVTEADISSAVRRGMADRGLMLIPSVEKTEWTPLGKMRLCTLTVRFTIEDGDSGETREMVVIGEGTDQADKASYKAMTGAEKYALLKLFMIPTGDDPEKDDPRPPQGQQQEPPRSSAPKPTPPLAAQMAATRPAAPPAGKAETAKEEPKKTAAPKQDGALRNRAVRLWRNSSNAGASLEQFQAWTSKVLGRSSPSSEWDVTDMDRLESVQPPDWKAAVPAAPTTTAPPPVAPDPPAAGVSP